MMDEESMPSSAKEAGQPPPVVADTPTQAVSGAERPILYRPNVAAILLNAEGLLFVAERAHIRGSWQFPQGGVDPGEEWEEALFREVEEEIGVVPELIEIRERRGSYRYEFPKGRLKYGVYGGQEQVYYLCRFLGNDADINLDTKHREFGRWRWIRPERFDMEWVPRFKREVYRCVFRDFFGLEK
jgi:putative (di)nucleoside polyphosphate hydrolase